MKYGIFLLMVVGMGCTKPAGPNLWKLVKANSPQLHTTILKIESEKKGAPLGKPDSAFIPVLDKFGLLEPDHPDEFYGCLHSLHYYGYIRLNSTYMGAVFSYSVCSCCGDERLLLAVTDTNGNIKSAIMAAQVLSESECNGETTTRIKDSKLIVARREECGILEGSNEGMSAIDSGSEYYRISGNGDLVLELRDSVKFTR